MTLCWFLLIIFLALGEKKNNKGLLYAGIVMMYIYQVCKLSPSENRRFTN